MSKFPHLPAGREPGEQTRRSSSSGQFWAWFLMINGTWMYAAGVWLAAGGRGTRFDRREELLGGLFFVVMGLLAVYLGLSWWEARRPRRHPRLRGTTLVVGGEPLRRGDEISVTYTGRRAGEDLEVGLACDERFDVQVPVYVKGMTTVLRQTRDGVVHEDWQPVPAGAVEQTFTFSVPPDGPYSYEGECVSYAWRASARRVKALQEDPRFDQPIWVEP